MNSWKSIGRLVAAVVVVGLGWLAVASASEPPYEDEIVKWRNDREERLKSDEGWLTVAGLYWLREGENHFGSDPLNDFVLPEGSAPAQVGVFDYRAGKVTVRIEPGLEVTQHGKPVERAAMEMGSKDAISIGKLKLWVHYSGERLAIRLRDLNSSLRKEFTGLHWFPVSEKYRVEARFIAYDEPREIEMVNILGDVEKFQSPGVVAFELGGQKLELQARSGNEERLFFVFRDLTSGKETYPAARFLAAQRVDEDTVDMDFNKAYNPPCAFSPYTTCPIPPKENRLPIRIEAGEKKYH
jgi:uncharacterized protein (DUF1684 family)